jgi:maltose O-acetyltransferase
MTLRRHWNRFVHLTREEANSFQPRLSVALTLCRLLPPLTGGRLRRSILRLGGLRIGDRTVFAGGVRIAGGRYPADRLSIGVDCMINDGCRFDTSAAITIGDDVYLGHDVAVITSTHEVGTANRRAHVSISEPITIGDGSWVGTRAVILPGASIGLGCVVAAGAVVTKPVPANTMVGGVPARHLRDLE